MTDDDTVTAAIARYRRELDAEAELAAGDLDEIEDHLRTLTAELRDDGMPAAEAVTEAARRLGDPRELAREHARVRSPFGARISRARAWSAAALLVPALAWSAVEIVPHTGLWSRLALELCFGTVLAIALVARLAWARPVLLGGMAFFLVPSVLWLVSARDATPLWLLWHVAIIAFLVPWRRGELTGAALALALQVWAYGATSLVLGYQLTGPDGTSLVAGPAAATIAFATAILAVVGGVLRARWSAIAAALSALALAFAVNELSGLTFRLPHPDLYRAVVLAMMGSGALAAAISAVLAWRTARSTLGTFESVLR